ncbi:MAG: molecular chaperone HtpG [Francisellaceae bacterium]|nr:molecular chaperone HtpG [Francisellaceae bacterium]MBT6539613.1 molecular chaperone HtpG [Francisellaceae bacterium]
MSDNSQKETMGFQTEVKELLHLMIHSLYSNKEIFLRELISNASDAADKLRFLALGDSGLYEGDSDLKIWVDFDKDAKTVTIRDNGVGMSRDEVIKNLGTIAKSGTKEFMATLSGDRAKDSNAIGQFGVGFYSSFIVADKVEVFTRKAGVNSTEGVHWVSQGEGEFEIEQFDKSSRGTEIVLHLKSEEDEFLNSWKLRNIITRYADHIAIPVVMKKEALNTDEDKSEGEEDKSEDIIDVPEEEVVNRATAVWTLAKQEVTDEQYKELYKHISHDFEDPLVWSHNRVEGKLEYISLLYIPTRAPFDLWTAGKPKGLKLYVQRVFIMDEVEQFLPNYLRFVRGVIDSNDLPLNVSRELLQGNKTIESIKNALVKRVLDTLLKLATDKPDEYKKFWSEFGQVIKEGPAEDFANKEKISKLLRFATTHTGNAEQVVALEDYVGRMKEGQDKIYYVTADTFNAAKSSPHLEIMHKKGIEVLLLTDRVDEWLVAHLSEFEGKQFVSVAKGDLNLGDLEDESDKSIKDKAQEDFKDMLDKITKVLGDGIKEARMTTRLTNSPSCVVAEENAMSAHMERIMKAAGQNAPESKPVLELNPEHPLVQKLSNEIREDKFADLSWILFDQAVLAEGGQINEPAAFVKRFNDLILEAES